MVVGRPGLEPVERQRVRFQPKEIHSGSFDAEVAPAPMPEMPKQDVVAVGGPVRERAGPLELPKQHTHLIGVRTTSLTSYIGLEPIWYQQ